MERNERQRRGRGEGELEFAGAVEHVEMFAVPPSVESWNQHQPAMSEGANRCDAVIKAIPPADERDPCGMHLGCRGKRQFGVGLVLVR